MKAGEFTYEAIKHLPNVATSMTKHPELWIWYKPGIMTDDEYHPLRVIDDLPQTRVIDDVRGFELSPIYFDADNLPEPVGTDEEANSFGVYRRIKQDDGSFMSMHLADFNEREDAELFVSVKFPTAEYQDFTLLLSVNGDVEPELLKCDDRNDRVKQARHIRKNNLNDSGGLYAVDVNWNDRTLEIDTFSGDESLDQEGDEA